jgi:putative redox protein
MKATSVWVDGWRSILDDGRGHGVVVDLPTEDDGTNTGATALELAVMALAGCITTIFKMVAEKRRFNYKAFRVELEAEKPEHAATITSMKAKMELATDAEEKAAQTVLRLTLDTCPVGVIFHKAGIELNWALTVKKP